MNGSTLLGRLGLEALSVQELERNIRSVATKVHSSGSGSKSTPDQNPNQGIATLLVMVAVLTIIILFCCFSAPGIRGLCKRYIFRSCQYDDPSVDNARTSAPDCAVTPTVILLPCGRMLVMDRSVFSQLQADQSGIDLLELSANLMRNPLRMAGSTPSILDSDTTSKGISPTSLGYGPPAYEEIFGMKDFHLPPSYSEVSLMLKEQQRECFELKAVHVEQDESEEANEESSA
ncbi:uncharacterized protein [Euwallacea fornicatus]|uniref:uncharacterized protein isoform X2 n=1 Tax=Euwallacea fornicatus TaxID=995702 RepID=UPI0033902A8D